MHLWFHYRDLSSNSFGGSIPTQLASLKNLASLDLSSNSFGGPIPTQLASLKHLTYLDLSGNLFDGPIPPQLNSFVNLVYLDISNNDFSGPLPDKLENLVLLKYLNIQGTNLSGRIPDFTGQLQNLTQLMLMGNNFEGPLTAATFSSLTNLVALTLRNCSLAGPIPDIIWNLRGLYLLFLRRNKLNGTIPKWIINSTMNMNFFSSLNSSDDGGTHWENVGYNCSSDLTGYKCRVFNVDIQGMNVLNDFNIEKAAGDVGKGSWMYQGPLISAISVYPSKESGLSPPKMVAISLSVLILLIVLIVYFWKMEDNSHDEGMVELYPGGLYNFQKVKVAAKNFKHKLGNGAFGTFYEATLGNGMVVAVEKASATKDIIRAFRENDSTISLKEHPNFVKLMGFIAEKNQLLLIYEDIGHNSLQNALFGSDRSRLDWTKRRNICLGIAEGLAFLHEGKQKNVHGNIKPTTIFLDKQDNAKISDFRFSRLHDQGKLREEGTVVYMAPEFAKYDLLTTKADVYSFGVVVLIVVSGKKEKISMSSSGADTEYLPDLAVREKQREGHFMNLVDKSISNTVDWNQADTMLELALMCLDQYPDQRPTMSQVVKVLKEQLPLKDLKESLKQHSDPQPHALLEEQNYKSMLLFTCSDMLK
nr:probable LRR receptor-like serine/threonine-protein kinase At1g53430 [Ipomoea batatas]